MRKITKYQTALNARKEAEQAWENWRREICSNPTPAQAKMEEAQEEYRPAGYQVYYIPDGETAYTASTEQECWTWIDKLAIEDQNNYDVERVDLE
jgi:3-dehydroquinate synthetase